MYDTSLAIRTLKNQFPDEIGNTFTSAENMLFNAMQHPINCHPTLIHQITSRHK
jgi:hypothetical protein